MLGAEERGSRRKRKTLSKRADDDNTEEDIGQGLAEGKIQLVCEGNFMVTVAHRLSVHMWPASCNSLINRFIKWKNGRV